jgi:hypothetical protein
MFPNKDQDTPSPQGDCNVHKEMISRTCQYHCSTESTLRHEGVETLPSNHTTPRGEER